MSIVGPPPRSKLPPSGPRSSMLQSTAPATSFHPPPSRPSSTRLLGQALFRTTVLALALALGLSGCRASETRGGMGSEDARLLASQAAAPEPALRIEDREYPMEEFEKYLLDTAGPRFIQDFARLKLFEFEAERLGVLPDAAAHQQATRAALEEFIEQRYQGDADKYRADLEQHGQSPAAYEQSIALYTWGDLVQQAVALHEREVTAELLRERFEVEYGPGGVRTEVRHIILTRAREGLELAQRDVPAEERTPEKIQQRIVERALEIVAELEAGADFAQLAARYSHDNQASRTGGFIEKYDFLRYGPALATAIAEAEINTISDPVVTPTAVHVFEVTKRTHTEFAEVEDSLRARLESEPASPIELEGVTEDLRERYAVRTYLMP